MGTSGGWSNDQLDTITLPPSAGTGDARVVIGPDLPAILVSNLDAVGGIVFYSGFNALDEDYYFIVSASPGDSLNEMYFGYVRNGTDVFIQQYSFMASGAPDELETDYFSDVIRLESTPPHNVQVTGVHLEISDVGKGILIKEGANARMGRAVLVAGTVTVNTTQIAANSEVFVTCQIPGGTPGFLRVSARVAGTSFTILSSNAADTSTVAWLIMAPA